MNANFYDDDADNVLHRICKIDEGAEPDENEQVSITYVDARPPENAHVKGVILLIHGFPQTSYQFRKVISPLTQAGYRLIIPDYRGAGDSSKPTIIHGYRKTIMASDLHHVIKKELGIQEPIHVVGHDIGGMIAHAYAAKFPSDTASVVWGECPLPGTSLYEEIKESVTVWHFVFHRVTDLPEVLVAGNERAYIKYFIDKLVQNRAAIKPADVDLYEKAYAAPGAMRAGMNVYRTFNDDAKENVALRQTKGKSKVRCLALGGEKCFLAKHAEEQAREFYEDVEVATVPDSGHFIAEENPGGFAKRVLAFVSRD